MFDQSDAVTRHVSKIPALPLGIKPLHEDGGSRQREEFGHFSFDLGESRR
jgi:hypothetical protein